MKFVDAHIHLSDSEYSQKVGEIIEDAKRCMHAQIFQNFTNFFGVSGVRDKRHEEGNSLTMEGN